MFFVPGYGAYSDSVIGRSSHILEQRHARTQNTSPATIFVGMRGIGKTVLLEMIAAEARDQGRTVVSLEADPERGFITKIIDSLVPNKRTEKTSFGIHTGLITASTTIAGTTRPLADALASAATKKGLTICVDEIHDGLTDLRILAELHQQSIKEGWWFEVCLAGLPILKLPKNFPTYLERARWVDLGLLPLVHAEDVYRRGLPQRTSEEITTLAHASGGFPYALQLLGSYAEQYKQTPIADILALFERTMRETICYPRLQKLSPTEWEYATILAELTTDNPHALIHNADVASGMNKKPSQTSPFASRLAQKNITVSSRGPLTFPFPCFSAAILEKETAPTKTLHRRR